MYETKRVILPEHEVDLVGLYCHECETQMKPWVGSSWFYVQGIRYIIDNIHGYRCESCGNIVYSSNEAYLIGSAIRGTLEE